MPMYLRAIALIFIGLFLCVVLKRGAGEFALGISIILSTILLTYAIEYLQPIISLANKLQDMSGIESKIFKILIKSVGIGLLSEIVTLICNDVGYSAIGKTVQMFTSITIVWICIPLFEGLIDLMEKILVCA